MPERLFLCGLDPTQRAEFGEGYELQLHGPRKNVRLDLEQLRRRMLDVEPELLTDFAEIATYIFAADCLVSRGGRTLPGMGKAWRRQFRLVIAVRRRAIWSGPGLIHALSEALEFMSEDTWQFDFLEIQNSPPIHGYIRFSDTGVDPSAKAMVIPFSGGLDSFAGAVKELRETDRHVVLLSRGIGGITDKRQRELADELKRRHPGRLTHVPVGVGLTDETKSVEHTQRTRSIVLAAMATIVAEIEGTDCIRFFENGVMSVNLPIATQVIGARASRSTHPRTLMLLQDLCQQVRGSNMTIDNPFIWWTKSEIVATLNKGPEGDAIRRTLSCTRTRDIDTYKPHCGTCIQCLQRRIATLGAGASLADPEEAYRIDLLTGPRQFGEDRLMAVDAVRSALEYGNLSEIGFATKFAGELAWVITGFASMSSSDVTRSCASMHRRYSDVVRSIFTQAAADRAGELIEHTLPASCLLQLVVNSPDTDVAPLTTEVAVPPSLERRVSSDAISERDESPRLVIDEARRQLQIDGCPVQLSPTEYRLISELARLYREDREAELAPESYRTITADDLAELMGSAGDDYGRKVVQRIRRKIAKEHSQLFGDDLHADAIIENVPGKGYRLNPAVWIIASDQPKPDAVT